MCRSHQARLNLRTRRCRRTIVHVERGLVSTQPHHLRRFLKCPLDKRGAPQCNYISTVPEGIGVKFWPAGQNYARSVISFVPQYKYTATLLHRHRRFTDGGYCYLTTKVTTEIWIKQNFFFPFILMSFYNLKFLF